MASLWYGMLALLQNRAITKKTSFKAVILIIKNVLIEFGYPALLDLYLFVHFMYWLPILTGNALTGIMAGKICADGFLFSYDYELRSNETQNYF
jgi:hypothetical protein